MSHAITINLPDELYKQARQAAILARQPLDVIVAQSLTHSLPPLLEDIPDEYQADVYPLLAMTDTELQAVMRQMFPADQWVDYETLLEKKKEQPLSADEASRLDKLRRDADILTFRKAYAAVLLKRRGHAIPSLAELSAD
ncbi:MAG: hypothetical protein R3A44_12910 [Caldilineaceae bacterium]